MLQDVLIHSAWKGMALLILASLVTATLRRHSAAARRWVWSSALFGLLLIPGVSVGTPALGWARYLEFPLAGVQAHAATDVEHSPPQAALLYANSLPFSEQPSLRTERSEAQPADAGRDSQVASQGLRTRQAETSINAPHQEGFLRPQYRDFLVVAWLVGVVVALSRLIMGTIGLRRLERAAEDASSRTLGRIVAQSSSSLGIVRPIRTLVIPQLEIPMTWGTISPRIALPADALSWTRDRLQMVLLHELTHVRRWDGAVLWVARISCAVHWFNPLAWWGMRRLQAELEASCDDCVLEHGVSAADYAEELLEITSRRPLRSWGESLAMGASRAKRIQSRLSAILDDRRDRRGLSQGAAGLMLACSLFVTASIGSLQLHEVQAESEVPISHALVNSVAPSALDLASTDAEAGLRAVGVAEAEPQSPAAPVPQASKPPIEPAAEKSVVEIRSLIKSRFARPLDDEALNGAAIKGMLHALDDQYSELIPPAKLTELYQALEGKLTGIGAQMSLEGNRLTVITALPDSPALEAGLRPGDKVVAVDGTLVEKVGAQAALVSIRGQAGSTVRLKLIRGTGGEEELEVKRATIQPMPIQGLALNAEGRWDHWLDRKKGIAYIQIAEFSARMPEVFQSTVLSLKEGGLKGLILDLRNCPGGLLNGAIDVARMLLANGVIVTVKGPDEPQSEYRVVEPGKLSDFPLLLLVNEHTASASEVLSAALRENGRAVVVGTRTYGKGSVQSIFNLAETGALKLTTAYFFSPSGKRIDRQPGSAHWGVDPSDGFYVPLSDERLAQWLKSWQQRRVIDPTRRDVAAPVDSLTPEEIETRFSDPQLAAGLQSMSSKLETGTYTVVGKSEVALQSYYNRREYLRQQREDAMKKVQAIDKELSEALK